jgi:hypothetical protein
VKKFTRKSINRSTLNIIIFRLCCNFASIIFTAVIGYTTSKKAVVDKLKSSDLHYILKSMSAQIDGKIERAKESSILIADDPAIQAWFQSGEKDANYKEMVIRRITDFSAAFDYSNIFMANDITKNYWNNGHWVDVLY